MNDASLQSQPLSPLPPAAEDKGASQPNSFLAILFKILISLGAIGLLTLAIRQAYTDFPLSGSLLGKFSMRWSLIYAGLVGLALLELAALLLALWAPGRAGILKRALAAWRKTPAWLRWLVGSLALLIPAWVALFSPWAYAFTANVVRLLLLVLVTPIFAACFSREGGEPGFQMALLSGGLFGGGLLVIAGQLAVVTNYPFALGWSEGNRLYDYSVFFGANRYLHTAPIPTPHGGVGRNILWGLLYLLPGTPIWLHRLWSAILNIAPFLLLGYLIACWKPHRPSGDGSQAGAAPWQAGSLARWTFAVWVFLFLYQGPIYTPLILSAILVAAFVRPDRLIRSAISTALASYYASFSRWTWLLAPAAWAALITLCSLAEQKPEATGQGRLQRLWADVRQTPLLPAALVAAAGIVAGALANSSLFSPRELAASDTFSQPLLWYRLLPNPTYPTGVLLALLIAAGPLALLLIWLVGSRRWPLNWLQALACLGAGLAFLAIGLVASVKIGGGNNLHNLDMFILTLVMLAGLAWQYSQSNWASPRASSALRGWPLAARGLLAIVALLPIWTAVQIGDPLDLPAQADITSALKVLQTRTDLAAQRGEVLFIDQRQLLTFGYLHGIPLVPDYEKKLMMDKAMAGDRTFFQQFYTDLANQRFSLIISDPLFETEKGQSDVFGDENNAWVKWVSTPLLCYYEPLKTLRAVRVQLLTPRQNPTGCP